MASRIPLGESEHQRLEFKPAAALDQPETIAREVVAMLNAEGGEVWIGLRENSGRAVEIEPIPSAESVAARLLDSLVDLLEPSPRDEEVRVEPVATEAGEGAILRVLATPESAWKLYAYLQGAAWYFPLRVAAGIRPMTPSEILSSRSKDAAETARAGAEETLTQQRQRALERELAGLWLAVAPYPALFLDLGAPLLRELATDPAASGNRRTGWSFARSFEPPRLTLEGVRWGWDYEQAQPRRTVEVEINEDGGAWFFSGFDSLEWKGEDIWPFSLMEYPISAFRILGRLYAEQVESPFRVVADLALLRVGSRRLKPGSPGTARFGSDQPGVVKDGDSLLPTRPLTFTRQEVIEEPDRCGYRLLKGIYAGFGLREEQIPREFDRETGRLLLPE